MHENSGNTLISVLPFTRQIKLHEGHHKAFHDTEYNHEGKKEKINKLEGSDTAKNRTENETETREEKITKTPMK